MKVESYYPNRTRVQFTGSTSWQIVATDGTGYSTYAALVAAGKTPFPGPVRDFPTGLPKMIARSVASGGVADGSPMQIRTNGISTPNDEDDLVSGTGQTLVYEDAAIKLVWVKLSVSSDSAVLTGFY